MGAEASKPLCVQVWRRSCCAIPDDSDVTLSHPPTLSAARLQASPLDGGKAAAQNAQEADELRKKAVEALMDAADNGSLRNMLAAPTASHVSQVAVQSIQGFAPHTPTRPPSLRLKNVSAKSICRRHSLGSPQRSPRQRSPRDKGEAQGWAKRRADSAPPIMLTTGLKLRRSSLSPRRSRAATHAATPCSSNSSPFTARWRNAFFDNEQNFSRQTTGQDVKEAGTSEVDLQPEGSATADQTAEFPCRLEGESWSDFLARARNTLTSRDLDITSPAKLFEVFRTTTDLGLVFASFAQLFQLATKATTGDCSQLELPPWAETEEAFSRRWQYPYEPLRLLLGGNWKAKRLWQLLDTRVERPEYKDSPCEEGRLAGQRALIVGAGPCGLRAAIELRLLGLPVTVVEKRCSFSRINQLHIWSWCGEDLRGLGARCIEPPPADFGANPDLLHIGIGDLQVFLLKAALLLGAEVTLGCEYLGAAWHPGLQCWQARLNPVPCGLDAVVEGKAGISRDSVPLQNLPLELPSPRASSVIDDVGVLMIANGFDSKIGESLGMKSLQKQSESAIGLICNFARTEGKGERSLRSFSLAKQFFVPLFKQVEEATGAELENFVYVKGHASHYFVMTPTLRSLKKIGVVKEMSNENMFSRGNVDQEALNRLCRSVAAFPLRGKPSVLEALEADLGGKTVAFADAGPRIFDFSKTQRMETGLAFVEPPIESGAGGGEDLLLTAVIGDALIEPFWPEGLGVVRGFFGTLDACSSVLLWAEGASRKDTVEHFEAAYQQLKTLSAATRAGVVHDNETKYGLLPASRYRQFGRSDAPKRARTATSCSPSPTLGGRVSRFNTSPQFTSPGSGVETSQTPSKIRNQASMEKVEERESKEEQIIEPRKIEEFDNDKNANDYLLTFCAEEADVPLGLNFHAAPPGYVEVTGVQHDTFAKRVGFTVGGHIMQVNGQDLQDMSKDVFQELMDTRPLRIIYKPMFSKISGG